MIADRKMICHKKAHIMIIGLAAKSLVVVPLSCHPAQSEHYDGDCIARPQTARASEQS
jgi:hypothetical protein